MPAALSKLALRNASLVGCSVIGLYYICRIRLNREIKRQNAVDAVACAYDRKEAKKDRVHVDNAFFRQLGQLIKIIIPGVFTSESFYLTLVACTLISRTRWDLWMINNGTVTERAIITRDQSLFRKSMEEFIIRMPLVAFVNNLLKFGLNELRLRFRTRLSNYLYSRYMSGITFYQMSNLDSRLSNPDQLLTQDVEKFCNSLVELYSNVSKPLLDIIIYVQGLSTSIGGQAPSMMILYLLVVGFILTRIRRPLARLTVIEQKLEGEYRYVNSRLITNSEEVAFYQGADKEKSTILGTFERLIKHMRNLLQFHFCMGYIDTIVAKYLATVVGYSLISRPFFSNRELGDPSSDRLENYYRSGRMLVKLAEAIGRLVLAGREMTRLAGFTSRVSQLTKVLDDLNKGKYVRTMMDSNQEKAHYNPNMVAGAGRIITLDNIIKFEKVPLVTPNGDVLVEDLTFEVKSGVNVLVCGPNGCGKSSLFRILGELWPSFGGTLVKPAKNKLFYIPQRPYMTLGTLRDQVIYPDTKEMMTTKGVNDSDLAYFMEKVQLTYLLEREGSWETIQDWMDVLSGGEKQRIAMARLFYRKPQFAILDECTSAVSVDVEGSIYQFCKEEGITLFTVSHRKSLWKYHEYYLLMDGRGKSEFKKIEEETEEYGS